MVRPLPSRSVEAASIRSINQPRPLAVEADDKGLPLELTQHGSKHVAAIQDVWRIDDEWWRDLISRRYFRVVLDSGEIRTIYHDLVSGEWFEQWY
ncbi:MAG TPA: hypothetical protein VMM78_09775 [Thermomicrobiales bacterium]|nr:hypothetical protein [Thermomicrobiales bacterium]